MLLYAQANSASYPQWNGKWVAASLQFPTLAFCWCTVSAQWSSLFRILKSFYYLLTCLLTYLLKGLVLLNVFLLIDSRVYSAIISLHTFTFTFETAPSFISCITDADGNTPAWSMTFSRVCQLVCVYVCLFAFTDQTAADIFTKLGSYYLATPTSFILKVKDQDQGLGLGLELSWSALIIISIECPLVYFTLLMSLIFIFKRLTLL